MEWNVIGQAFLCAGAHGWTATLGAVSSRSRLAALLAVAALTVLGASASGDSGRSRPASVSAQAYARQDPTGPPVDLVTLKEDGGTSGDATHVTARTSGGKASAEATAEFKDVDIFDGLVTAKEVKVRASAGGDGTSTSGSVSGLTIGGTAVDAPAGRTTYDMAGYGQLVALGSGATGVLGLRARLDKPYKTHAAGEVVKIAYASATAHDAVTAPGATAPTTSAPGEKKRTPKPARKNAKRKLTAKEKLARALSKRERQLAARLLATPGYAFPVAGSHNFVDTFGAPRSDVPVHIGNDVFAAFGTPIVAVADGRLYRVGTLKISGNRLWLRDHGGYRYFYAHLSDFAAAAYNGADVHAGEVIGFVGNTGDAEPTPPHLHFEVHMPNGAVVDPYPYLQKWGNSGVSSASWIRRYGQDPGVRPGALVVVKDFLAEP
jgi:murein DD-endopeptidase MepM/ murein hydrolase activator NlpD